MDVLDIALRFYDRYEQLEEINNYYGLLSQYALVQVCHEKADASLLDRCRRMLMQYPDNVTHPHYNFPCYRLGGNASAWADMMGLQKRRPGELAAFARQTMNGPKDKNGILCMPGREKEGWIWIDTLTAVTPFLLFAGIACKEEAFVAFASQQCFTMIDALYDPTCGLLHQCRGFLPEGQCSADHWSRGNGWGYLALAELVQYLPANDSRRSKAEKYFTELTQALAPCQSEHGLWRQELTRPDAWEESSGTALILYGIGIGLRTGLLPKERYWMVFEKGLLGLLRWGATPDFDTLCSCPGCLCPGDGSIQAYIQEKQPEKNEHHSFGAYMLALVEGHRNGITQIPWPL